MCNAIEPDRALDHVCDATARAGTLPHRVRNSLLRRYLVSAPPRIGRVGRVSGPSVCGIVFVSVRTVCVSVLID